MLLRGAPDVAEIDAAARAFGLVRQGAPIEAFGLWAELAPVVRTFERVLTQWRTGPSGPIGLDYAVLPDSCSPRAGSRAARRRFAWLQVMEDEALGWFAERAQR